MLGRPCSVGRSQFPAEDRTCIRHCAHGSLGLMWRAVASTDGLEMDLSSLQEPRLSDPEKGPFEGILCVYLKQ